MTSGGPPTSLSPFLGSAALSTAAFTDDLQVRGFRQHTLSPGLLSSSGPPPGLYTAAVRMPAWKVTVWRLGHQDESQLCRFYHHNYSIKSETALHVLACPLFPKRTEKHNGTSHLWLKCYPTHICTYPHTHALVNTETRKHKAFHAPGSTMGAAAGLHAARGRRPVPSSPCLEANPQLTFTSTSPTVKRK